MYTREFSRNVSFSDELARLFIDESNREKSSFRGKLMKRSSYYFARVLNNRVTVNYYSKRNLLNGVTSLNNRRERGSILSISRHRFPFIIFHGLLLPLVGRNTVYYGRVIIYCFTILTHYWP